MSQEAQTPTERIDPRSSQPAVSRDEALFGHLFASRPAQQRRGPWVLAALFHLPLLYFFFTSDIGQRVLQRAETFLTPILTVDDNPPALVEPALILPVEVAVEPAIEPVVPGPAQNPLLPVPRVPDPAAVAGPPTQGQGLPGAGAGSAGGTGGSAIDRMAVPRPDPLLFAPTNPSGLLSGPEGARSRLADRIGVFNDSVAAERLAAARSTDWTVTDKDGKRWGVSPGKLHLGDITLPLPLAFAPAPGRRDEVNSQLRTFAEIEAQASRAEIRDSFNDRVKEIRKRKERERAEKIADKSADKKKSGSN